MDRNPGFGVLRNRACAPEGDTLVTFQSYKQAYSVCPLGRSSLFFKDVCYTNVHENSVWDKVSSHKARVNVRDHGELSPNNRSDINIYSWIKRCEEIISQVKSFISGTLSYCFFGNFLFPGLFVFPFWNSSVNNKIFRIYPLIVFYFLPFPPFLFVLLYDWLLPLFSFHSVITFLTSAVIFVNFQNIFLSFWMVLTFCLFVSLFVSWVWAYQLKWLFVFCLLLLPTSPCLL